MVIFFSSIISVFGILGLSAIPFSNVVTDTYCFIFSLLVNDFVKVKLMTNTSLMFSGAVVYSSNVLGILFESKVKLRDLIIL
jgi:hypothetical protein